jgi:L-asparagine oxygenase
MKTIAADYTFSDTEHNGMVAALSKINISPYDNYTNFREEIREILTKSPFDGFQNVAENLKSYSLYDRPWFVFQNCPIDSDLPVFGNQSPVEEKRRLKTTFVAEGFLESYAQLMDQVPIGYVNVNDGDVFQDIFPKDGMFESQSQKALGNIYFHKDLANHFVRPDWVNILGLRGSSDNEIYTSFVSNKEILEILDEDVKSALRKSDYHTPFDDLTVYGGRKALGEAPHHQVLGGAEEYDLRFFENRTLGVTPEASEAIDILIQTLHKLKAGVNILPRTFAASANNECLHNKEIMAIRDHKAQRSRWLMKTVNIRSIEQHLPYFMDDNKHVVNG